MQMAPIPLNEAARVAALHRLDDIIGSEQSGQAFERVVRTAQRLFGASAVSFTLIDQHETYSRVCKGMDGVRIKRGGALCDHVVTANSLVVAEDTREDPRFADNALVVEAPNIRFYAGYPIRDARNFVIGALGVLDTVPRSFNAEDRETLEDLANWLELVLLGRGLGDAHRELVAALADVHRENRVDPLTRVLNRKGGEEMLEKAIADARKCENGLIVGMVDLDHFKAVNDLFGHQAGDRVLADAATRLQRVLRKYDVVARMGGEEFMVVVPEVVASCLPRFQEKLCGAVAAEPSLHQGRVIEVTASAGIVFADFSEGDWTAQELVAAADEALYQAKRNGRNRSELADLVASAQ